MSQFDSSDLKVGARFLIQVEVVEDIDTSNQNIAFFVSSPDWLISDTLFDVVSIEKILTKK